MEREVYNPETGQYELVYDDGIYETNQPAPEPWTPPKPPTTGASTAGDFNNIAPPPPGGTGSAKTRAQLEEEGRAADLAAGLIGGYFNESTGRWESGSPGTVKPGGGGSVYGGGAGTGGAGVGTYAGGGDFQGQYNFPMLDLPAYQDYEDFAPEEWKAPTPDEVERDPSYQFRFDEGMKPLTNSRAAQGLTNTGATLKAMTRYGQNFGSNEFGRIYDRAADSYDRRNSSKFQAWNANRQSHLDKYDRRSNEAEREFAPRQRWAELTFGRDFDLYKYKNDSERDIWKTQGQWANNIATAGMNDSD